MHTRLEVARALLHGPDLLFLDEPTSGLDPVNARRVVDLVRERQRGGVTVFLTTHDMAVADALCDRVAFVVDGRIAAIGTPRELRLAGGTRRVRVERRNAAGGTQVREFALEGLGEQPEFLAWLRAGDVETVHTTEASLADVFVQVTGRRLL
jgi:fluoroquinolone transport system ATP-binding protein